MTAQSIETLLQEGVDIRAKPHPALERAQATGFQGLYQAADNWCWAAAAAMVATFYDRRSNPAAPVRRQCDIVNCMKVFGTAACPAANVTPRFCERLTTRDELDAPPRQCQVHDAYDRQYYLGRALRELDALERMIPIRSQRSFRVLLRKPRPGSAQPNAPRGGIGQDRDEIEVERWIGAGLDFDETKELLDAGRLVCLRTVKDGIRHFIIIYGCETYPDADLLIWDPVSGPEVIGSDRLEHEYGPFSHKIITRQPKKPRC
jgi:hypothetical protein